MTEYNGSSYDNLYPYTNTAIIELSQSNKTLYGVNMVDQALQILATRSNALAVSLQVLDDNDTPIPNVAIDGYTEATATNEDGMAFGFISESPTTLSIDSSYADIQGSVDVEGNTKAILKAAYNDSATYDNTTSIKLSNACTSLDVKAIGGESGNGAEGEVVEQSNVPFEANQTIPVIVGAKGTEGEDGGDTAVLGFVAKGGEGGATTLSTSQPSKVVLYMHHNQGETETT